MLADLIHHLRADLSSAQLTRVVNIYTAMIHNPALSGGIQTMCAKLLMTVTESITNKDETIIRRVASQVSNKDIEAIIDIARHTS